MSHHRHVEGVQWSEKANKWQARFFLPSHYGSKRRVSCLIANCDTEEEAQSAYVRQMAWQNRYVVNGKEV